MAIEYPSFVFRTLFLQAVMHVIHKVYYSKRTN